MARDIHSTVCGFLEAWGFGKQCRRPVLRECVVERRRRVQPVRGKNVWGLAVMGGVL